jgi:hypothetical protein
VGFAYAPDAMTEPAPKNGREEQAAKEQGQADERRRKDETEKVERDRADEAGRQSREGT